MVLAEEQHHAGLVGLYHDEAAHGDDGSQQQYAASDNLEGILILDAEAEQQAGNYQCSHNGKQHHETIQGKSLEVKLLILHNYSCLESDINLILQR